MIGSTTVQHIQNLSAEMHKHYYRIRRRACRNAWRSHAEAARDIKSTSARRNAWRCANVHKPLVRSDLPIPTVQIHAWHGQIVNMKMLGGQAGGPPFHNLPDLDTQSAPKTLENTYRHYRSTRMVLSRSWTQVGFHKSSKAKFQVWPFAFIQTQPFS